MLILSGGTVPNVINQMSKSQAVPVQWDKSSVYDWQIDIKSQTLQCDKELKILLFGDEQHEVSAGLLFDLLPKSQRAQIKQAFKSVLESGNSQRVSCCLLAPGILFAYVEIKIDRVSPHQLSGTLSPSLIINDKHQLTEVFYFLFENHHHGILVADELTKILVCNHHYEELTGYANNEIAGLKTSIFNAEKHSDAYYDHLWGQLSQQGHWSGTILTRRADGSVFPQDLTIQKIQSTNRAPFFIGLSADLSGKLERIDDIESGGIDLLTQLPNREGFLALLTHACNDIQKGQGLVVVALQPKLDSTAEVKRQFASYLKDNAHTLCCGYLGHDCFALCLPFEFQSNQHVVTQIGRSITKLFHSFKHAQLPVAMALKSGVTGVSVFQADATTPSQLVSHAYQAVLELHSGHERRINFYDRQIHQQIERKKRIEEHVIDTLSKGNIEVYFQPIVDLKMQLVVKFEALCRFPDHEEFVASTQEMIEAVEDLDKVVELDDLVLVNALQQFPDLQQRFGSHVSLSVNRSLKTTTELTDILERAAKILDAQGTEPELITFEFTESAYFDSDEKNREILSLLRGAGVKIAVDDFGTGSASFRYLKECYFDTLKIDRTFIQDITPDSRQYNIVKALVHLSAKLGLEVIAEGVETEQELNAVRELGVNLIQGYYFSKPLPLAELRTDKECYRVADREPQAADDSLGHIVEISHHIDPGEPLSLVYQYFSEGEHECFPVVETKECVGFIDLPSINLHLTPNMGTDLESNKENAYWNKPANRIMQPIATTLHWQTPQSEIAQLVANERPFPWCLVDDKGQFKGLVSQKSALKCLVNNSYVS